MPTLKCLGSSSAGNCFLLTVSNGCLVLDLGVEWKVLMGAIDYDLARIIASVVSHGHGDHSKIVKKALKYCIPVYSCSEVAEKYDGVQVLRPNTRYRVGDFIVQPLPVQHNVENYAYIITHPEVGKLVFALDCVQFPYRINGVNHWIIEANHDESLMIDHMCENIFSQSASINHLNIDQCIDVLQGHLCCDTRTIVFAHLSDDNSNADNFLGRTKGELGFENVYIADKGLEIELNK